MFQARHYEFLAAWLRELYADQGYPGPTPAVMSYVILSLADKLAADNPRFDRARFLKAAIGK